MLFIKTILLFSLSISFLSCQTNDLNQKNNTPPPKTTEGKGIELNVLSYNIHHCNPPSKPEVIDIDAISQILKNSNAEVIGLQEVDVYTERSGKDLHMAKVLAEKSGYPYYFFSKSINYQGGEYGTAILSKYPLYDTITKKLPNPAKAEARSLSVAKVKINDTLSISFANTHLDYTNLENNMEQVKEVCDYLSQSKVPVILTGDFNAKPNTSSINYMLNFFEFSCMADCSFTAPASKPNKTIDYICFRNGTYKIKPLDYSVLSEKYASDHLPIKARLKIF